MSYTSTAVFTAIFRIGICICSLVVSLCMVFVACEVMLRVAKSNPEVRDWGFLTPPVQSFYDIDETRIYKINANIDVESLFDHKSDAEGFRFNPRHNGSFNAINRLILVGDSFTYGHGVRHEETLPYLLEQKLLTQNQSYWVDNAGVPGYGPDQEFLYITETLLPTYKPTVLVWVHNENDIVESASMCLFTKFESGYKKFSGTRNTIYLKRKFIHPLIAALPAYVRNTVTVKYILQFFETPNTLGCSSNNGLTYEDFYKKMVFFYRETKKLADTTNTIVLAVIPLGQGAFSSNQKRINQATNVRASFHRAAEEAGIPLIDLIEIMYEDSRRLGVPHSIYHDQLFIRTENFPTDSHHPNAKGNAITSSILFDSLKIPFGITENLVK